MNRKVLLWLMALVVLIPAIIGTGYWVYWDQFIRYAPVTITSAEDLPRIQKLLNQADYLTPGAQDKSMYLVTYRSCKTCNDYEDKELPKFQASNIETRIVVFALPDQAGAIRSTPEERSTIAELWLTRNWNFYKAWHMSTDETWTAEGLPIADDSLARTAVVGAGRGFNDQINELLRRNKVTVSYPLLIWRDKNNQLRVCGCSNEKAWHFVREEMGAKEAPPEIFGVEVPTELLPKFGSEGATSSSAAAGPPTKAPETK
ncbi:hypothetical protein [Asticcacaulis sp. AC460]|uniref:hypothetical protein n=1 Tax=Asticcacaulis sp. AC460 TaxID=1282360 RepID=UPI0012DECBB2|nr:hypothetical protein [Asticcacaulis sp. AC460]